MTYDLEFRIYMFLFGATITGPALFLIYCSDSSVHKIKRWLSGGMIRGIFFADISRFFNMAETRTTQKRIGYYVLPVGILFLLGSIL